MGGQVSPLTMYKLQYNFVTLPGYIFVRINKSILYKTWQFCYFLGSFERCRWFFTKRSLSKVEKTVEGTTVKSLYSGHHGGP